ncbi:MAG: hypothetical protein U5K56_08855 [Halioglobus sp.]|nr:hypothetical protein [Halioglobus sp.]
MAQEGLPDLSDEANPRESTPATAGRGQAPGNEPGATPSQGTAGDVAGSGGTDATGPGGGGRDGPLTPTEEVAVLDAELERGTGDFDDMILERQREQRRKAREHAPDPGNNGGENSAATGSGASGGDNSREGDMADAGNYSHGGGIGGASGGGAIPDNPAKYPPPGDIPDGDDDDVVARQLREAAMREPDPAVRERLWDEYRKYKGIEQ